MTNHTDLEHALLIKPYMPARELRVGDRVSAICYPPNETMEGYIAQTAGRTHAYIRFDSGSEMLINNKFLTRLYTFTEIWEELPADVLIKGLLYSPVMKKRDGITTMQYSWFDGSDLGLFETTNPANAVDELLKWVKERK